MKKVYLVIFGLVVLSVAVYFFSKPDQAPTASQNVFNQASQEVLRDTIGLSQEYFDLRWQTELILTTASSYPDYETWNKEMTKLVSAWENYEQKAKDLGEAAAVFAGEKKLSRLDLSPLSLISPASALTAQEITNVFDKAPAGKKIKTLASHLGVDAKHAYAILKQSQAEIEAGAWTEAGDTFQKLETSAVVIKDGCKVAGFVGGVIISGGAAGFAAAGTVTKAAVVVSGVDLALEVTEDGANIALGNNNKVAELVGNVRAVTDPAATILNITSVPDNLVSGFDKFNAVMLALDQFRNAAQEGKVVGVSLPVYEGKAKAEAAGKIEAVAIDDNEVADWLSSLGLERISGDFEEVLEKARQLAQAEIKEQVKAEAEGRIEEATEEMQAEDEVVESEVQASAEDDMAAQIEAFEASLNQTVPTGEVQLTFSGPEGDTFQKGQARMWELKVENFSKDAGANYVCHWTFYLNGSKFREMPDNRGCAFTSTFIDQKGSLRAEVRIDFTQGRSVFDENGKYVEYVTDVVDSKTLTRDFIVN